MTRSDGKVALITAAGDYVGPALARVLAASGHSLVLHAVKLELVDELVARGTEVALVERVDLSSAAGNQTLVQTALDRFGRLDWRTGSR